jgi:hypothetical protein
MTKIPQTFEEWEHCITVQCGIPLTPSFVAIRIAELEDESNFKTRKFIETWGREHHARTVAWFRRAASRLSE